MSSVIAQSELDRVLVALDQLGLADLGLFVGASRAAVQQQAGLVLDSGGGPRSQFRADALALNQRADLPQALEAWLDVAALQLGNSEGAPAREVRSKNFAPGRSPSIGALEIPEKIILKDDTVAFDWLTRAVAAGNATAWLAVPRYFEGIQKAGTASGTGLLLDETHLLTCLHVLEARTLGEAKPEERDLALQVQGTRVAFGYVAGSQPQVTIGAVSLVCSEPELDYAVIQLEAASDQPLPPLYLGALPEGTDEGAFVVNILQHPGGGAKRLAMRNNAVARVDDSLIAYWTDTDYGSSGAPVFDDDWRVIALHRAYEERSGLTYLGRNVGGANVGSRITKIVEHLRACGHHALVARLNIQS